MSATKELAYFLGISETEAQRKVNNYIPAQHAKAWADIKEHTPAALEEFYRKDKDYIYDLVKWNDMPAFKARVEPLMAYRNKKILEIGAGVGALCIALALNGNDVTYYDINELNKEFAVKRFADRLLSIKVVDSLNGLRDYDMVVAIDTMEHIHPEILKPLLKNIYGILNDNGFFYHRSNFGQQKQYPMHYDHNDIINKYAQEIGFIVLPNGDYGKAKKTKGINIGIPIRGNEINVETFKSILNMDFPIGSTVTIIKEHPVDLARNEIVKKIDRDWLLFLDSDQIFPAGVAARLMSWNKEIISGLVFKRGGYPVPMAYKYRYQVDKGHYYEPLNMEVGGYLEQHKDLWWNASKGAIILPPAQGLLECDGVPCGCLLVHRRVFEAIPEPWFECAPGKRFGEDFDFCRKVQKAGFKIYVDPSVVCGHIETHYRGAVDYWTWSMKEPYPIKEGDDNAQASAG